MTSRTGAPVNKNIILVIATITAFIMPFLAASMNVALPSMGRDFSMEAVVMSWVNTSYFLAIAVVQLPFGRLADIIGRKRLFTCGLVIAAAASLLGFFANSVTMLIISRVFQGFGSGMTFNNAIAILTSVFPAEERAKALGVSQAGTYLGISLGPLIGGMLTESFGWRSIFMASSVLGFLMVALVFLGIRAEWREAKDEKFDIRGTIIYGVSIALFMYGFSSITSLTGIVLFIIGAAGMGLFIWWETRVHSPVLDLTLFRRNRVFSFSNLAVLVIYISSFAITFYLSLYLQYIKDYTAKTAGLVLITSSVIMTVFTLLTGFMFRRAKPRLVAAIGMAINCIALIMLIFLDRGTPIWYIVIALAIYGTGMGLFVAPNTNVIMGSVENRLLGVASGILGTMRTAGMMLSMGIVMVLFSIYIGSAEITPPHYNDFLISTRVGFSIFSILCFCGVIAQMIARRNSKERLPQ